ncbi:FAD-dependent monooxygenase [Caulobacter sp. RL271]|jgi:2,4-dichlorophenol 6-monooxygenase|uniref:FAD-dependent monooxygenase n=1 Tax=Caulobacter segnis TaxID=88688 RepID=A0ABY4ZRW0_9CAUL|nr:FAD-dependent monooxygenase [Caulobacter segnis]USQ95446.1 FAD-dependent monooxygenase [Caulobacter segnis]
MSIEQLDLLIVGAGPAGLLASIIASSIGLTHQVIERRTGLHTEPSAHVLKTHSMEVYRRIGVADKILEQSTPVELQQCITWCESVGGLHYGQLSLAGKKGRVPRFTEISPGHSANLPQSLLEPILHRRAAFMAGRDPVAFGAAFRSLVQDGEGVTATVERAEGTSQIKARYVIGADGAGSRVRRSVGIAMEGPQALAHFLAIHIKSDMTEALKRGPGVLFFVRTPTREGFFIMHQPIGSQVFMMRFDPEATPFESFDEAQCRAIVEEVMGCPHDFTISAIDRWAMSAQVAERYREGRVVLVGDAGHRFPPTGGLGLNTGVEDVENLIWKVAAVIRGQAGDSLIDSYETECRPVAIRNTNQSVNNHVRMREVAMAIGAEEPPEAFAAVIAALRADPAHPRFEAIRTAVDAQMPHFAFLEMEMASMAENGAFLPAERAIAEPVEAVEGYRPSFRPGGQMPHLWVEPGVSTIDLLHFDRFTLFAPSQDAELWREAATSLDAPMAVQVVAIDATMRSERVSAADFWGGQPFAILVRPDGRIAWVEPETGQTRRDQLAAALSCVLGRPLQSSVTKVA